jgi:uncharacterized membrane protein YraQ (UPF0718 family)/copper chaperone CopZ
MSGLPLQILSGAWTTLCVMAPYLLAGFLAAGVLSLFIRPEWVERHLGGRGLKPVAKAALLGVPLPLCSCGVIPVAAGLRRHGASRGATVAFLLSTPQTGADNILVVLSLLGPVFAVFSPIAAFATGLLGGTLTALAERSEASAPAPCAGDCCASGTGARALWSGLQYGFVTLARDIAAPLLVGVLIAGTLTALVPEDFFTGALGTGFTGILVMMLLGIPVYVCATASVPIAAALMLKGVSPGAALAFLITGPATNAATVATVWKMLGRRTAFIYLGTILVAALGLGLLLNAVFAATGASPKPTLAAAHVHAEGVGPFRVTAAVALLVVLGASFLPRRAKGTAEEVANAMTLQVTGMTCAHCAEKVRAALAALPGVCAAQVDLAAGRATVTGEALDAEGLCQALRDAGYEATVEEEQAACGKV